MIYDNWSRFRSYLRKLIDSDMPKALPMRHFSEEGDFTWEDWHEKMQAEKPIRYFLFKTLPSKFHVKIVMPIDNFFYWIKSRVVKKDHLLDLRQPKTNSDDDYKWGYLDCDCKILFACFNVLVEHVKNGNECQFHYGINDIERLKEDINNEKDESIKSSMEQQLASLQELKTIYDYWTDERKKSLEEKNKALTEWYESSKNKNESNKTYRDYVLKYNEDFDSKEEEMLIRLIKIRKHLWI